jgi:hypothetical protein
MLDEDDVVLPGGPAALTPDDIDAAAPSTPADRSPRCTVAACRRTGMHDVDGALYCWPCYQQEG